MGKYRINKTNGNGERLINLADKNNLKIMNFFQERAYKRKQTWKSPDGHTKNEIDHFLPNDKRVGTNCEVLNNFQFSLDHKVGRAIIKIPKSLHI